MSDHILKAIEEASGRLLEQGQGRGHLGASQIGRACQRAVWYGFRWAYQEKHTPRMLRLFNRGHEEERRLTQWLRGAGFTVRDYTKSLRYDADNDVFSYRDWTDSPEPDEGLDDYLYDLARSRGYPLEQWTFLDHGGHYAGSCDGKVMFPEGMRGAPEGWGLLEYKTHNTKSFVTLKQKAVVTSKPTHYVQMQCYMHEFDLPWALYIAVNKNDDDLYAEIVYRKPELGAQYRDRALKIIDAKDAPAKYSKDPSWFECKYCAFREICHYDKVPQKNCRSCAFASAAPEGTWYCDHHHGTIPPDFIKEGCPSWDPIK